MVPNDGLVASASTKPSDWCGRPGTVRELQEVAFGHIVVEDPVSCDVSSSLLCVDQLRGRWSPREVGGRACPIVYGRTQSSITPGAQ
jgi:hypothetical protein